MCLTAGFRVLSYIDQGAWDSHCGAASHRGVKYIFRWVCGKVNGLICGKCM